MYGNQTKWESGKWNDDYIEGNIYIYKETTLQNSSLNLLCHIDQHSIDVEKKIPSFQKGPTILMVSTKERK